MTIYVCSYKGGVGKSTTAVHLAAYLHSQGPTLLCDADPNKSTLGWYRRGTNGQLAGMAFPVIPELAFAKYIKPGMHVVVDTAARPGRDDLQAVAESADLIVIPTTPDILSIDAVLATVATLRDLKAEKFRILLNIVPARPSRDGDNARAALVDAGLPLFRSQVRRAVLFQHAALAGLTVADMRDPKAAECWSDFVNVGKELL